MKFSSSFLKKSDKNGGSENPNSPPSSLKLIFKKENNKTYNLI